MKKIKIDFAHAIDLKNIFIYKDRVKEIHEKMEKFETAGAAFLGWKDLPNRINLNEVKQIEESAAFLHKEKIEVLVVIGIGGSYLGAKAGLDFIYGPYPSKSDLKMRVIFAGESLSATDLAQKLKYVENKKFAINVISKSGTTLEPAIAFRMFKKLLEDKVGRHNAPKYIFATTDASKGSLFNFATHEGYQKFVIPDDIGGRFSVLTPVGLFPFACAGINIKKLLNGAKFATEEYSSGNLNDNDAYQYAVVRNIFYKEKNLNVEFLISYEPALRFFLEWWKQLFGESEGKNGKGILPHSAIFSTDLHSLGQFIQDGTKMFFETVMTIKQPAINLSLLEVPEDEDFDKLNYLSGKPIHQINQSAFEATMDAHSLVGKIPNVHIEIFELDEEALGQLIIFFERAVAMSGYLIEVNPFDQPGVEVYKSNMFRILKKPV